MKKIISIILCAILVLGMAVNSFAATDNSLRPLPNNPTPNAPMNPAPSEPDIIVITIGEEANPNTGAPVMGLGIVACIAAGAVVSGFKK